MASHYYSNFSPEVCLLLENCEFKLVAEVYHVVRTLTPAAAWGWGLGVEAATK